MARLRHISTGSHHTLFASHLIGRSHVCALRLRSRLVSGEHAKLRWSGGGWELRDLSSSNGTFVDERRLDPGATIAVTAGSRLAFGDVTDRFELVDDSPPLAMAQRADGAVVTADDGVLVVPDPQHPELFVYEDTPGRWFAESSDGDCRPVEDHETVHIGCSSWRLMLPSVWARTWQPEGSPIRIADIALRFWVSRNEEHVEIELHHQGRVIALEPRTHGYLLLTLARLRWQDRRRPELAEAEHGWVDVPELVKMLDTSEGMLNVAIHRARRQLREAHVIDAEKLVERRRPSRQIRLGVRDVELVDQSGRSGRSRQGGG